MLSWEEFVFVFIIDWVLFTFSGLCPIHYAQTIQLPCPWVVCQLEYHRLWRFDYSYRSLHWFSDRLLTLHKPARYIRPVYTFILISSVACGSTSDYWCVHVRWYVFGDERGLDLHEKMGWLLNACSILNCTECIQRFTPVVYMHKYTACQWCLDCSLVV
jgi:hypothetical protein